MRACHAAIRATAGGRVLPKGCRQSPAHVCWCVVRSMTRLAGSRKGCRLRSTISTRSEEHTSELQSLMRTSYAVFCLKKKTKTCTATNKKENQSELHSIMRISSVVYYITNTTTTT